ncbi:MAG: hypothetical protein ACRBB6_04510 [Neptuniibacter sp.]
MTLEEGFYTPFGVIFEVRDGTLYVYNHNGVRTRYSGGLNKNFDQAAKYLRKRPEVVFKGECKQTLHQIQKLKNNAQIRKQETV